jgi:hypothetical protein
VVITIVNFKDLTNNLLPLLDNHSLDGTKLQDYLSWKRAHKLMSEGSHLTIEGLNTIRTIK